jgi:hypothetical protein
MTNVPPITIPFLFSAIISSIDYGSQAGHTIYGMVVDEAGNNVDGADVLIESAVDRRHTVSSLDGSFFSDIYVSGFFDEISVRASFGPKQGVKRISARRPHMAVDIVLH